VVGAVGWVLVQEVFNGGAGVGYDGFTLFGREADHARVEPRMIFDPGLMGREGELSRESFTAYLRVMPGDLTA